jgi:hypothetical protein
MAQIDAEEIRRFIYERVVNRPEFRVVIMVSIERYPSEYSAIIWVGQEPTHEMHQYSYELERELEGLGVSCSILIKHDSELAQGGLYTLDVNGREYSYRTYRIDPSGDEDQVYGFALYHEGRAYRFRLSLTGTLSAMLRHRGVSEDQILSAYRDWILAQLKTGDVDPDRLNEKMFSSSEVSLFVRG